jgi:uncharacterized protein YndB with AHSA1/START domain
MINRFEISVVLPASPAEVYSAWLSANKHGLMTGGKVSIKPLTGSAFTAWDGYISGRILELVPTKKIVQSWRTMDFAPDDPDSFVEVRLEANARGCELTLVHSLIPEHQPDYEQGWKDNYFVPMQAYFKQSGRQ